MESENIDKNNGTKMNKVHFVIEEWKRRRLQDEVDFLNETKTSEYKKMMEKLQGKIEKHGILSAS